MDNSNDPTQPRLPSRPRAGCLLVPRQAALARLFFGSVVLICVVAVLRNADAIPYALERLFSGF